MDLYYIPAALLFVALILSFYLKRALRVDSLEESVPQPKKVLVPSAEQPLVMQVEQLLDSSCRIFWHVSLHDLLRIGSGSRWIEPEQLAVLDGRRFACVVCDRDDFSILAVVDYYVANSDYSPAPAELIPGLLLPVAIVTEDDCKQGNLSGLLLSTFPGLETRLSAPPAVLSVIDERSALSGA